MSRIGVFVSRQWPDLEWLLRHEDEIKRYREVLGLNLAFVGALPVGRESHPPNAPFARSTECSSVRMPPSEIQAHNPFGEGVRDRLAPGARFVEDDSLLRRAIDAFHRHGIECWMVTLGWVASGAALYPEGMAVDLRGKRADELGASMFCPANQAVNRWFSAYLPYLVREYEADGVFFTHTRYPPSIDMLWACGCPSCRTLASELGFDFEAMRRGMLEFRRSLSELAPRTVRAVTALGLGMIDLMHSLEPAPGMREWFSFRAAVLSRALAAVGRALHAAKREAAFAVQGVFPSLSAVLGHPVGSWPPEVDQVVFMMSYVREVALRFVVSAAEFLMALSPKIPEHEALALACRVAGWAEVSDHLPARLAELQAKIAAKQIEWNPWYERVVGDEIEKGILVTRGTGVMIGLRGNTWPQEVADRLRAEALGQGASGVVYHSYTLPWS